MPVPDGPLSASQRCQEAGSDNELRLREASRETSQVDTLTAYYVPGAASHEGAVYTSGEAWGVRFCKRF
jgi:hypothetical protein